MERLCSAQQVSVGAGNQAHKQLETHGTAGENGSHKNSTI